MVSDIIVFIFVLLFVFLGYRSGLIKTVFGMCSFIVSIVLGVLIYPAIADILKNSSIYNAVLKFSEKHISFSIEGNSLFNEVLERAGAQAVAAVTELLINIISFIAVILICRIILFIVSKSLNFISKAPVISSVNRILGAAVGGIKGIILLYILFLLINFLPVNTSSAVVNDINKSSIACKFYKENLIIDILGKDIINING